MKLLELSKKYFLEYRNEFDTKDLAFGLVGEGSDCLGYDDDISKDHDLNFGFCIFVPDTYNYDAIFKLERTYAKLPKKFMGYKKPLIGPAGTNRRGVFKIGDFYRKHIGKFYDNLDNIEYYLHIAPFYLLNACNGEVFEDNFGEFTKIRNILRKGYPEDIRLKKLSIASIGAHQEGAYNYDRMINRNDIGAANLCLYAFIKDVISIIYLMNNAYEPYYKWAFRGIDDLRELKNLKSDLITLIDNGRYEDKHELIHKIIYNIEEEFNKKGISDVGHIGLDHHAVSLVNHIKDLNIRNLAF